MSRELQPPAPISLVKIELPTVIKNEPLESEIVEIGINDILDSSELEEEIIPDVKEIDIVWHPLCLDLIKSETIPENILESKHSESVETQVYVKTEDAPFVKIENITEMENLIKTEDTIDDNGQKVLNGINGINMRSRKAKHFKRTDFAVSYKTVESTSWEKDKEKILVIKAPVIPVEPHEYISLAKDEHICNHCQYTCSRLCNLKFHINKMHREVTTMYQCPYCPFKSKWSLRRHIIQYHKDSKDIHWFQCHLCEEKFKLKYKLAQHMKIHLTLDHGYGQMQERLELCLVCGEEFKTKFCVNKDMIIIHDNVERKCQECSYTTKEHQIKNTHKKNKRYSCEKCAFVNRNHAKFKLHALSHKTKAEMSDRDLKYRCDKCIYKTYRHENFKRHKLTHLKPEEIQYFYCYHCSYKSNQKEVLKRHIFKYLKNGEFKHQPETHTRKHKQRYPCDQCDYKTHSNQNLNRHKLSHLKPEEIEYFYCYHCSYKCQRKDYLKPHIFRHFKKEEIEFHCYICNFMALKRESIVDHIKKHPKIQIKSETN